MAEPGDAQTSLILAIVGLFCCGVVLGPIAIIKALAAKKIIALAPGTPGEGKANIAIALGAIDIAIWLFGGVFRFLLQSHPHYRY